MCACVCVRVCVRGNEHVLRDFKKKRKKKNILSVRCQCVGMCACVCVCVRVCVCISEWVCVGVCVCECGVWRDHGQTGVTRQWLGSNQEKEYNWMYE